jgi:hypothetical protein
MSKSQKRAMPKAILVRLTDQTAADARRLALAADMSDSSWLRQLVVDETSRHELDRNPVQVRGRAAVPAEDVIALQALAATANRLNGFLVQTCIALRERGIAGLHAEYEAGLEELHTYSDALDALIIRLSAADKADRKARAAAAKIV